MTDKAESSNKNDQSSERWVTIPHFPKSKDVRLLLRFWEAKNLEEVTGLRKSIQSLRGTPQKPVDWSNPQTWISERLKGKDRELASDMWNMSNHTVNPRHTDGAWTLCRRFKLLKEKRGVLKLTDAGQDFLQNEFGESEVEIDSMEGIFELLRLIEDYEPCQPKHLLPDWSTYLMQHSNNKTESVFKDTLNRRLVNLIYRGLVCKSEKNLYQLSNSGRSYLHQTSPSSSPNEQDEIVMLARK
ncbi:MAG: restriction endonuclease, partial [Gammaproteobacteria bacterium]|nr:restriction endonuclease [Gammaproteobacteria bacterium]